MGAAASQRRFLYFGMRMVPTAYCHLAIASELQVSCFVICNPAFAGCARWQYGVGTIVIPKHRNRRWLVVAATFFPLYPCLNNFSREAAVIEPRAHLIARHEHCALRRRGRRGRRPLRIVNFKDLYILKNCKIPYAVEQRRKKAVEHAYRYGNIGYKAMCFSLTSCVLLVKPMIF